MVYMAIALTVVGVFGIVCALGWGITENKLELAHRRERKLIAENSRYKEMNRKLEFRTALTSTIVEMYRDNDSRLGM